MIKIDGPHEERLYNVLSQFKTVCIALKCIPFEINTNLILYMNNKFSHINLNLNMRNSENILNASSALGSHNLSFDHLMLKKNIKGNCNFFYENIYNLDEATLTVLFIEKYYQKENVVVMVPYDIKEVVAAKLKRHFSQSTKVVCCQSPTDNVTIKEYLKKPDGIYVTSIEGFQGAQASNMIIILNETMNTFQPYLRNIVLRAMSQVIVIITGKVRTKLVPGFEEDKSLIEDILDNIQHVKTSNVKTDLQYYRNIYKTDQSTLTLGVLKKYFNNNLKRNLVILTHEGEEMFKLLEQIPNSPAKTSIMDLVVFVRERKK